MNALSGDERLILLEGLSTLESSYITNKLIDRIKRSRVIMLMFMMADKRREGQMERHDLKPAIDLNRIAERGTEPRVPATQPLTHYAPKPRNGNSASMPTALTGIAATITKLTWREAEAMGAGIAAKMGDGVSLTAAIQAWADDNALEH